MSFVRSSIGKVRLFSMRFRRGLLLLAEARAESPSMCRVLKVLSVGEETAFFSTCGHAVGAR